MAAYRRCSLPSLYGQAMLLGIALEHFADTAMHRFLRSEQRKAVCQEGLWSYSRHPNYLGEITFWTGVFLSMIFCASDHWYYAAGCICVAILFNTVSIPLMEKRRLSRRPEYAAYRKHLPPAFEAA